MYPLLDSALSLTRGVPICDDDLLADNILFNNGAKWKLLRKKLTPLFTSAKLRNMYYIIDKSAQDFVEFLKLNPDKLKGEAHSIYDTITHFNSAAISASVFGIETKSTFESPFREMIVKAIKPSLDLNLKFAIGAISEKLYKVLNLKLFNKHESFFIGAMKKVIKNRKEEEIIRHDFADLCVKLQKEGTMVDLDNNLSIEPTDEVLAAEAFFFFIAGIEPCTASMFSTMMEMGRHPEILKRVHEEVDAVFEKYNYQLTFDAIAEMDYLDRVLSESLRMYPPLGLLSRKCMRDTVLPVGNVPVKKGVKVYFPVYDFHYDPKYHPNPEVFDPDRFLKEEEINDLTYLPFGRGNRICIGARYARLQVLSGLMHFLRHYTVKTHELEGGIQYERSPMLVRPKNILIEFIPRS
ncbi:unnamed protein product [Arctia plantaginis]|uniref:unspecific monooxygenase n=1 Tax=Arctia plantaginis TaxID=874455 RepID=A0A8S1BBA3_ARCPL|nr:unnamed protein product [Arctia plantaginis]